MSAKINTGGSAFPEIVTEPANDGNGNHYGQVYSYGGMTLRDYFAGQALVAMRAHQANDQPESAAHWCYQVADAMIAERGKK